VDEYATFVFANLTKTSYIDPRDRIDSRAFYDILPPVNASTPGICTPRHETYKFLTEENRISSPATDIDTESAMAFTQHSRMRRSKQL
jgi:hypothetical protein